MPTLNFILCFVVAQGDAVSVEELRGELRALQGLRGVLDGTLRRDGDASAVQAMAQELHREHVRLLDRTDLPEPLRLEAIDGLRALAHSLEAEFGAVGGSAAPSPLHDPSPNGASPHRALLREIHADLIRRAQVAGVDVIALETAMLSSRTVGLDPRERYQRLERLLPRLRDPGRVLPPAQTNEIRQILYDLLDEPNWPEIDGGDGLPEIVDLLWRLPPPSVALSAAGDGTRGDERTDGQRVGAKLALWTQRLLRDAAANEGQLARTPALVHLYRALEIAAPRLSDSERRRALEGLEPLAPPVLGDAPPGCEGGFTSVEVGEVHTLAASGTKVARGLRLPSLRAELSGGNSSYLLPPRSSYLVELLATSQTGGAKPVYWVLARAGAGAELTLPRCVPAGMVPITSAETGRITFLADRRPWTVRRLLQALQRSGSRVASDVGFLERLHAQSVLRDLLPLKDSRADFPLLVGILSSAPPRAEVDSLFWVDVHDRAGRATAFELASAVLSGNTGLKDTPLSLPTVAEAQRLWRDGELFGLDIPGDGTFSLFNSSRIVPEPREASAAQRCVIRTVIRVAAP